MADWTIPNPITPKTKIADTDDRLQANMEDLRNYVNGTGNWTPETGLTQFMVDKATPQTITAQKTFNTAIIAQGGVVGNLTGNVTGNVVGDVTGNISVIPNGIIVMWGGAIIDIPAGWNLCDGTNGTVDLRSKFVVCGDGDASGTDYQIANTAGSDSTTLSEAQLPAHTHAITVGADGHSHTGTTNSNGAHSHTYGGFSDTGSQSSGGVFARSQAVEATSSAGAHTHTFTTDIDSHSHTASAATTGSGTAIDNRPAFYALAYIQKV